VQHDSEPISGSATPLPIPDPELIRAQKQRILADPLFSSSKRFCDLLEYLVESAIAPQDEQPKERTVGIEVFGKSASYDTSADPTVRVAASSLRKRLTRYYEQPEHAAELRIEIPVRSYTAIFFQPKVEAAAEIPAASEAPQILGERKIGLFFRHAASRRAMLFALAAFLVVAIPIISWHFIQSSSLINQFWSPILSSSDPVDILIGSPLDSTWPIPTATATSAATSLAPDPLVKVGMIDTKAAVELATFLRAHGKTVNILPAPITLVESSHPHPVILYGRFQQEWVAQLGADLRLRFRKDPDQALRWIEDAQDPSNHSWAIHLSTPDDQLPYDYAVLSRIHDATTNRW